MKKMLNLLLVVTLLVSTISIPLTASAVENTTLVTSTDNFETAGTGTNTINSAYTIIASVPTSNKYYMARGVWPSDSANYKIYSARPYNSYGYKGDQTVKIPVDNTSPSNTLDYNDVVVVKTKIACANSRGGGRVEVYDDNNVVIAAFIIGPSTTLDGATTTPLKLTEDNYPIGINLYTGGSANIATDTSKITLLNFPNYVLSSKTATVATAIFYELKMVLDFRAKKLNAYIDGVEYASNISFNSDSTEGTNVGYVLLGTNLNNAGYNSTSTYSQMPVYFDDYEVSITDTVSIVPVATNITVDGSPTIDSTLTANYTFVPKTGGALEDTTATTYQWTACDSADGTYTDITGATAKTMTVTRDIVGKYIKCKVLPVDLDGNIGGSIAQVTAFGPIESDGNCPPKILSFPINTGAVYDVGETIALTPTVSDVDNDISKVEFFSGDTVIAESLVAPYNVAWAITSGSHSIKAKVTDLMGNTAETTPATITATTKCYDTIGLENFNGATTFPTAVLDLSSSVATVENDKGKLSATGTETSVIYVGKDCDIYNNFAWESEITISNTEYTYDILRIYQSAYNTILQIKEGQLIVVDKTDSDDRTVAATIEPNVPYKIKMIYNISTKFADVFVNDVKVVSQTYMEKLTYTSKVTAIRSALDSTASNIAGYILFDDYGIYQVTDLGEVASASVKYEDDNSDVVALKDGGKIIANANVQSYTGTTATVVAVLYDNDGLISDIQLTTLTFTSNTTLTSENLTTQLPADATGYKYKIFVFNSIGKIAPIPFNSALTYLINGVTK